MEWIHHLNKYVSFAFKKQKYLYCLIAQYVCHLLSIYTIVNKIKIFYFMSSQCAFACALLSFGSEGSILFLSDIE